MLTFNDLLRSANIDPAEVKLLRHETSVAGRTPYSVWRNDSKAFELYQQAQGIGRRSDLRLPIWASFVVTPAKETLFVGLYKASLFEGVANPYVDPLTGEDRDQSNTDFYQTIALDSLSDLIGRLIISWNAGTRQWIQHAAGRERPVVQINASFEEPAFPGYADLILSLDQIQAIPSRWRDALQATKGVYLLTCPKTREIYVGSATGSDGFLGRWTQYARDGHGGNVRLKSREPSNYQVGILQVAGSDDDDDAVLEMEALWKRKLQTRAMGLNSN